MTWLDKTEKLGVVVAWDEDHPGRVKVALPSIMGNKVDIDLLPWTTIASTANGDGPTSSGRPPQPGSWVNVKFSSGSGSVAGIITNIINGERNPEALTGVDLNNAIGWLKDALNFKPEMNKPPNTKQVAESNVTGVEKITTIIEEAGQVLSMVERVNLPSTLAAPLFVPAYAALSNVSTAVDAAAGAFSSSMSSLIPGIPLDLPGLLGKAGLGNIGAALSSHSPLSGSNFTAIGSRISEAGISNFIDEFQNFSGSFSELSSRLNSFLNDPAATGALDLFPISISVDLLGSKGAITLGADGSLSLDVGDIIKQLLDELSGVVNSVEIATGTLLSGSDIISTMNRLPSEALAKVHDVLNAVPEALDTALVKARAALG